MMKPPKKTAVPACRENNDVNIKSIVQRAGSAGTVIDIELLFRVVNDSVESDMEHAD